MTTGSRLGVLIAGGGTGGHLYPGIAVARELLRQVPDATVSFVGTARGIEARVVPREGFVLDVIRSAGLKGKSVTARARGAALILPSLSDAWRVVSARRPSMVIGVGGYSSGPVVLAAALRGIPTMVLEQNAVPGLTNRLLAHVVRAAAVTYDETLPFFKGKAFVAGNPVRPEFFGVPDEASRPGRQGPRVLILGGSQGAHGVNVAVAHALPSVLAAHPGLDVVHQTGAQDVEMVRAAYGTAGMRARVDAFLDPVVPDVAAADLVISRAGATTLAELAAAGRPAVLVPLPTATDDHQRKNARVLEAAGAAVLVEQSAARDRLAAVVARLLGDPDTLGRMRRAMRTFAKPDAARRIVARVRELAA